jgi:integrase
MKREYGDGTVFQRANGNWYASIRWKDDSGRHKRTELRAANRASAQKALRQLRTRLANDGTPQDATMTLTTWCESWILSSLAASARRETTKATYATLIRVHVEPEIGHQRLCDLRLSHIERWLQTIQARRSSSTARQVHSLLVLILDSAIAHGLLVRNPAKLMKRPKRGASKSFSYSTRDVKQLLKAAHGERLEHLLLVLAYTGLRKGEALALRWSDISTDGDSPYLRVEGTLARINGQLARSAPKTFAGRRAVPLIAPAVRALTTVRAKQNQERLMAGESWHHQDLVFTNEVGGALDPRNVLRWFYRIRNLAGISEGSIHTLRHSAASTLLESGVPMPEIRDILGHSSISITVDLYGHLSAQHLGTVMKKGLTAYGP